MTLNHNILLDEEEFAKASTDLAQLSADLETLRGKINTMLESLKDGFNTPGGRLFRLSCQNRLLEPLRDQRLVIDLISQTLNNSRTKYNSVFEAYRNLNSTISNSAV